MDLNYYQILRRCCNKRLTDVIPIQHENPSSMGLPPDFINFTILVFSPIAAIARMIKNLLRSLKGAKNDDDIPKDVAMVVIIEANKK